MRGRSDCLRSMIRRPSVFQLCSYVHTKPLGGMPRMQKSSLPRDAVRATAMLATIIFYAMNAAFNGLTAVILATIHSRSFYFMENFAKRKAHLIICSQRPLPISSSKSPRL